MATTHLRGNPVKTSGELPAQGAKAPAFELCRQDLSTASAGTFEGKKKILNIFPSIDTGICAQSVRTFHEKAAGREGVVVLNISADLPFAAKRFCGAEGIEAAETLSTFRSSFATDFGVRLEDGPMAGLCARAVLVLGEDDTVLHAQLVDEIGTEPDYDAALAALG